MKHIDPVKHTYLSIVIPAYNEATNIRLGALDKVSRYIEHQTYPWEVILVDDGSDDQTGKLIDEFIENNPGFRVIHKSHQGKAAAVITGMRQGRGEIVLFTDLDQATPIDQLEKLLPWFGKDFDIVIGSRHTTREGAPLLRQVMARSFMIIRSVVLGISGIEDTQCGFKAFKRDVAQTIFERLKLYGQRQTVRGAKVTAGFDIEVLYLAKKLSYKIKEVSVEWHYVETRRVNPLTDSWQGLLDIINIRINSWKGLYE